MEIIIPGTANLSLFVVAAVALLVVPRPIRDLAYRVVAANRHRIFGTRVTCRVPTADERSRFLS